MIPMPFQKGIENPKADYVPLSRWGQLSALNWKKYRIRRSILGLSGVGGIHEQY